MLTTAKQILLNTNFDYQKEYIVFNGRVIEFKDVKELSEDDFITVHKRLFGGKGGFGSMLRAIGSQIEKTTNHEMCRDLTGRRMRDVNAEKKLREWYENASERERKKAREYLERRKKRQEILEKGPLANHKFEDTKYMCQKEQISAGLQDAISTAATRIIARSIADSQAGPSSYKKTKLWIQKYDEIDVTSSSESDQNENESGQCLSKGFLCEKLESIIGSFSHEETNTCYSEPKSHDYDNQLDLSINQNQQKSYDLDKSEVNLNMKASAEGKVAEIIPLTDEQLKQVSSVTELESFGFDILKASLMKRGLKCSGNLSERAIRLFSVRSLSSEKYPKSVLAKPLKHKLNES